MVGLCKTSQIMGIEIKTNRFWRLLWAISDMSGMMNIITDRYQIGPMTRLRVMIPVGSNKTSLIMSRKLLIRPPVQWFWVYSAIKMMVEEMMTIGITYGIRLRKRFQVYARAFWAFFSMPCLKKVGF